MQRTSSGFMFSIDAICLRNRCVCCDALHDVSLPSTYSATAHDGPIEPCVWIAKSYVAFICLTPGATSASALLPTFCRSLSLLNVDDMQSLNGVCFSCGLADADQF